MNIFWVVFSILYVAACTFASIAISNAVNLDSLPARALIAGFLFVSISSIPYQKLGAVIRRTRAESSNKTFSTPAPARNRGIWTIFAEFAFPFLVVAGGSYLAMLVARDAPRKPIIFTSFFSGAICTGVAMLVAEVRSSFGSWRKSKRN